MLILASHSDCKHSPEGNKQADRKNVRWQESDGLLSPSLGAYWGGGDSSLRFE